VLAFVPPKKAKKQQRLEVIKRKIAQSTFSFIQFHAN
jgi:hypothetical protein